MFYDRAKITVRSGDGGDGMISFRREKHVPLGGPDGGDGGRGGDIKFRTNASMSSLVRFHRRNQYRAGDGGHGGKANKSGAYGETLILDVPMGTMIRSSDSQDLLADMTAVDQEVTILAGGQGGRGNRRFVSSVNRAPRLAERGEPGSELWLELELRLIADAGIVGVPNAGKSTLLAAVSAARPKIANYPFTTLQPNLGMVELDDFDAFVLADIPGLIEGAAEGTGLGYEFLRHVDRTRVLIHLLDGAAADPLEEWAMINQELSAYSGDLGHKPQLVVLNKLDLPDALAWEPLLAEEMARRQQPFCSISAATGAGVRSMLYRVKQMLDSLPPPAPAAAVETVIGAPTDEEAFEISRVGDGWRVRGKGIERVAAMTYFEFDDTLLRFQRILESMGISDALQDAGVQVGDIVRIGEQELEWAD